MTPQFVLDCSLAASWLFVDERSEGSVLLLERLRREAAIVPALWQLEVANVLLVAERRKRLKPHDASRFLQAVRRLEIQIAHPTHAGHLEDLLRLGRAHRLTSYDAAYLDLALRSRLPLATLDDDLRRAAAEEGVAVL